MKFFIILLILFIGCESNINNSDNIKYLQNNNIHVYGPHDTCNIIYKKENYEN